MKESATMGPVYANAVCMISATASMNSWKAAFARDKHGWTSLSVHYERVEKAHLSYGARR